MAKDSIIQMLVETPEFKGAITTAVRTALNEHHPKKEQPIFYSEREACDILHISKPTAYKYRKMGILTASKVGSRLLFTEENIQNAIVEIPSVRYKRI